MLGNPTQSQKSTAEPVLVPMHGVLELDAFGRILFANPTFCQRSGLSLSELIDHPLKKFVSQQDHAALLSLTRMRNSPTANLHLLLPGPSGPRAVLASVVSFFGDDGDLEGSVLFFSPLSSLNPGTQDLLWSEKRAQLLLNQVAELLVVTDAQFRIQYVNSAVEGALGYRPKELLGHTPDDLFPPEDLQRVEQERAIWADQQGLPQIFKRRMVHKDGSLRSFDGHAINLTEHPLVRGYLFSLRDITEQESLRDQAQEVRRLEGIGRLAGGIAHDFNNVLTVVLGQVELMEARLADDAKALRGLNEIRVAANRASGMVNQLLAFARRSIVVQRALDLRAAILALQPTLEHLVTHRVQISFDLPQGLPVILADAQQVEQVLLNLAANARDAMPAGGRLGIACRKASVSPGPQNSRDLKPGEYLLMSVTDSGVGMDSLTLEHAFEPFFTTKTGANTGMGLSTCYGILKQGGGHIEVSSWPDEGTRFDIYWPLATVGSSAKVEAAHGEAPLPGQDELVLLVDDEDQLRSFVEEGLIGLGYRVVSFADGESALEWLKKGGKPRLLITDMKMPGIGGEALAGRVHAIEPALPVLYISGYAASAVARLSWLKPGVNFLSKPFTLAELAKVMRPLLAGPLK